ncbi:DUF5133 domain-containing protein [Streptomyces parvulus]|uniref:DUF5133 domain-containing protein n=1 Tax=Streptomyces parvulus TaxID=146923 RepID=UPI0015EFDCA2|nr:DUF5133 domain-containing protein [Streptomyces parvulus]
MLWRTRDRRGQSRNFCDRTESAGRELGDVSCTLCAMTATQSAEQALSAAGLLLGRSTKEVPSADGTQAGQGLAA